MATIKSFTSLEQSKKLAEILPLESADMHYWKRTWRKGDYAISVGHSKELQEGFTSKEIEYISCWSLAALLGVLPAGKSLIHGENTHKYKLINCLVDAEWHDNPVDACCEMILKLNELKML